MESIIQAIDLVRSIEQKSMAAYPVAKTPLRPRTANDPPVRKIALDPRHLLKNRIVSYVSNEESQAFDVLRTQLLQDIDTHGWQYLAVTSPTAKCGKSTVACNLAINMARLSDRAVLLVDLNFRNPSLSNFLGVRCTSGIAEVLDETAGLQDALIEATLGSTSFAFLPATSTIDHPSDLLASQSMIAFLQILKREFPNRIVIFDLAEVLTGDDVMSILPQMDAVVLVVAAEKSSIEDVRECKKYIERKPIARLVVNKAHVKRVREH